MMRVLLLGLLLAGCGEVSAAGVTIEDDGGAAGATGSGGGGSTGAAGTTGAGGAAGTGADALPPSCAYTPEMITGTWSATFNSTKASTGGECGVQMLFAIVDHGQMVDWTRSGFSATPTPRDPTNCDIGIYFQRDSVQCGMERLSASFTLPAL